MASEKIHIGVALFLGILMLLVFSVGVNDYRITGNPVDEGDNETAVLGCMDDTANNYNADVTEDDGSCTYDVVEVLGCMDDTANNYNADANTDDGSCTYDVVEVLGCMDDTANNYNADANTDDDSCTYDVVEVLGCMDDTANNYNADANIGDGSCTYNEANDNNEVDPVYGCTDSSAENYYSGATTDDGSCNYDDDGAAFNNQDDQVFDIDSRVDELIRELEASQEGEENEGEVLENSGDVEIAEINQLTGGVIGDDANSNITCDEGCILNERCYGVERRKNVTYCSNETISWVAQRAINETCSDNFECVSNSCKVREIVDCEGEECTQDKFCTEAGLVKRFFNWLKIALRIE